MEWWMILLIIVGVVGILLLVMTVWAHSGRKLTNAERACFGNNPGTRNRYMMFDMSKKGHPSVADERCMSPKECFDGVRDKFPNNPKLTCDNDIPDSMWKSERKFKMKQSDPEWTEKNL